MRAKTKMRYDNCMLTCVYKGERVTKNYNEWSEITGVPVETINGRVKRRAINHTDEMCAGLKELARRPRDVVQSFDSNSRSNTPEAVAKRRKLFNLSAGISRRPLLVSADDDDA